MTSVFILPHFLHCGKEIKIKSRKVLMVRNRTKKLEVDENQEANTSQKDDCVECRVDEGAVNSREDVEAYGENTGRFGSERTEMKLCSRRAE